MSADALARRIADHLRGIEGTGAAWAIEVDDAREGYARIAMVVRRDMLNGHATCHGGMIFALADTAFAYACNSRNVQTVAQSATIAFLAPGREGDRLVAEAGAGVVRPVRRLSGDGDQPERRENRCFPGPFACAGRRDH